MFGIGSTELLIICVVALVVLGPSKLPEILRTFGKGLAEFRKLSSDVKSTLDTEVRRAEDEGREREREAKRKREEAREKAAEAAPPKPAKPVDDAAPDNPEVAEMAQQPEQEAPGHEMVEEIEDLPEDGLAKDGLDEESAQENTPEKDAKA